MKAKNIPINWENHRITPVKCIFTPRPTFKGRDVRPFLVEKTGMELELIAMWLMDRDDPYPGEYALSTPDSCWLLNRALHVQWIASGDVTVKDYDRQ